MFQKQMWCYLIGFTKDHKNVKTVLLYSIVTLKSNTDKFIFQHLLLRKYPQINRKRKQILVVGFK